jgi:hypothetical protein
MSKSAPTQCVGHYTRYQQSPDHGADRKYGLVRVEVDILVNNAGASTGGPKRHAVQGTAAVPA